MCAHVSVWVYRHIQYVCAWVCVVRILCVRGMPPAHCNDRQPNEKLGSD